LGFGRDPNRCIGRLIPHILKYLGRRDNNRLRSSRDLGLGQRSLAVCRQGIGGGSVRRLRGFGLTDRPRFVHGGRKIGYFPLLQPVSGVRVCTGGKG
jgi:hypothetical protein